MVMLPLNSEVSDPIVAVAVRTVPFTTPAGIATTKVYLFVVSVPWLRPLISPGPYVPEVASVSAPEPSVSVVR